MSTLKGRLKRVSVRARNMLTPARDPGSSAVGPRSSSLGMLGSLLDDRALERELRRDGGSGDAIFQDKFGGRARQLLARVRSVPLAARDLGSTLHRSAEHIASRTNLTLLVITVGARAAPPAVHLHAITVSRDTLQFEIEWSVALRELRRIAWPVRNSTAVTESSQLAGTKVGPLMTLEFRADGKEAPARVFGLELLPHLHSPRGPAEIDGDTAGSLSRQQCVWSILRLLRYEPALALAHAKERASPRKSETNTVSCSPASTVSAPGSDGISARSAVSNLDTGLSGSTDDDESKNNRARDTTGSNLLFGGVALDGIDLVALQGAVRGSRFAQKLDSSIAAMCTGEMPRREESTENKLSTTPDTAATAPCETAGLELDLLDSASGIGSALGTGLLSSTGVPLSQSDVTAVEELLNSHEWRRAQVGELEKSLVDRAEHLEARNLELLLRWGEGNVDGGEGNVDWGDGGDSSDASGAGCASDDEGEDDAEGCGTASVRELVEELDAVDAELEALQARLGAHAPLLEDVRRDVTRLEGANNRLELERRNATNLLHVLHELLAKLQLDGATLSLLSDPASSLADADRAHNSLGAGMRGQTRVVEASQALGRAIRAASDPSLKLGASTLLACRERAAELIPRAQNFGQSIREYMRRRFEVVISARGLRNACAGQGSESAASSARSSMASMWIGIDDDEVGGVQQAPSVRRVARPRFSFSDVQLPSGSQRLKSVPLDSYMFHNDLRWEQPLMIAMSELDDALNLHCGAALDSSASSTSDTGWRSSGVTHVASDENKSALAAGCGALVGSIVAVYEEVVGVMYANDITVWFGELSAATVSAARGIRLNTLPPATIHSVQKELLAVSAQHKRSCATLTAAVAMRAALAQLVPLMLREATFVREFFSLSRHPDTVARVLGVLFGKLEKHFSKLIDSAVDDPAGMLSTLLECKQLLCRGSERCWPPPLISFLAELQAQLSARFERYVDEQCAWIAGRAVDTRQAGVLPAVLRIPSLIDRLNIVGQYFCQQIGVDNTAAAGDGGDVLDVNVDDPLATISDAQAKLVGALFKWLEKTASSKPKYREIVRMENYFFFCETVGARRLPALVAFVEQAREAFVGAMGRYCEWVLSGQFSRLMGFFEKLKEHFGSMPANEVQFYIKRAEFDAMRAQNALDMDKSLRKLRDRIAKHLCAEAGLLGVVWDKTMDDFISMYSEFEALAERCYEGSEKLLPSSSDLRAMAIALSQDGADATVPAAVAAITAVAAHDDGRR